MLAMVPAILGDVALDSVYWNKDEREAGVLELRRIAKVAQTLARDIQRQRDPK